ncbi:MAG: hypothetical protein CLLPBCKN_005695 [Chroococcidiopsis cubana SAG 39.79]|nr:hypothetical protein [Chroococcidiopsis cubana]MDZ4876275.1 hypothetical protein [Chroococcidiopsis cubana SAG 39.79]
MDAVAIATLSWMEYQHLVRLESIPNDPPADFPPYDVYPPTILSGFRP